MDVEVLQKMTVAELREEAKKLDDVKGIASMKKDDLVNLLAGASGAGATGPARGSGGMDRAALKQKIRELKKQRSTAGARAAKAKVSEYNTDLRRYRRLLRRSARRRRRSK